MSMRLRIGSTEKTHFECIITKPEGCLDKLKAEWLWYKEGSPFFLGPWKVSIGDVELYRQIEPDLIALFQWMGKDQKWPDSAWMIYKDDVSAPILEHPTMQRLQEWL